MAHHGEYAMLIAAANAALVRSLDDGDKRCYNGIWLEQSPTEHYRHACEHVAQIIMSDQNDIVDEQIDHAICRLIMLKIVRDENIIKGN